MALLLHKEWRLNPSVPATGSLADRILAGRNFGDSCKAVFFRASLADLHDPFLLPDMKPACDLLATAIKARQGIAIHGDYDVDGITAAALLSRFFRRLNIPVTEIIPDRMTDGYGLTDSGVRRILATGHRLLITVDCGSASLDEIRQLKDSGIKVIVTDHHECQLELPAADAVINPKRPDSLYPFRSLAGVGVALKLVQALCAVLALGDLWQTDLELAALGTVADVVPMLDENRIIVKNGLENLSKSRYPGIFALLQNVNHANRPVTAQTLGYILAPRINAAGRLGDAGIALELLLTEDPERAARAAAELGELNKRRQDMESSIVAEAAREIDSNFDFTRPDLIVVANEAWHQGVIGIVAARLAEQYCRPVIVLTGEDGDYRGSCRAWGDFDMLAAIAAASGHVIKFGGHRKAAGLAIAADQLDLFKKAVNAYAATALDPDNMHQVIHADAEVLPADLTLENALALQQMAPFGEENPQPQLICRQIVLDSIRPTGNGRHLKIELTAPESGRKLDGIAFGFGDCDDLYKIGEPVDLFFSLEVNEWMGKRTVQLAIRDMKPGMCLNTGIERAWMKGSLFDDRLGIKDLMDRHHLPREVLLPAKDEYKAVYQFIKARYEDQSLLADLSLLARRISCSYRIDLNEFRLARILTVFEETNLIWLQRLGSERVRLSLLPAQFRVRLEQSLTYRRLLAEEVTP